MKHLISFSFIFAMLLMSCTKESIPEEQIISRNITLEEAGNLKSFITADEILIINSLTISGPINGTDIRTLIKMSSEGELHDLDLSNASIVEGGSPYLSSSNDTYYTNNGIISTKMFSGCKKLQSIVLPRNLTGIGEEAFSYCKKLKTVVMHDVLDSIGSRAFYETSIDSVFNIPSNIRIMGKQAFAHTKVQKVIINSDILPIQSTSVYTVGGNSVFAFCDQLEEVIVNEGCTQLEIGFEDCRSLVKVSLPNSLTKLGSMSHYTHNHIFAYCEALDSITLPPNLLVIGDDCFKHCGIKSISIPQNVNTFGSYVFAYSNIKKFKVYWTTPISASDDIFYNVPLGQATLFVPNGTHNKYREKEPWKSFGYIIEQ